MSTLFEDAKVIVAVADDHDGMQFKRAHKLKRFKYVPVNKTDKEIVEKWIELIRLDEHSETWWLVSYYHDISRPEKIEFEKPVSGMQVGMMPVKLVQMMMNMGVGQYTEKQNAEYRMQNTVARHSEKSEAPQALARRSHEVQSESEIQVKENVQDVTLSLTKSSAIAQQTIYDPFCWFWTTGFVAHLSGHHFIGSDSNPTPTKQNLSRRNEIYPESKGLFFTVFKHDVTKVFTQPFLKKVDVVVTEWRLGPMVNNQLTHTRKENEWRDIIADIDRVYIWFLEHFHVINPDATIVITYPQWTFWEQDMSWNFQRAGEKLGYIVENIGVYKRKGQYTGRRVIRLIK